MSPAWAILRRNLGRIWSRPSEWTFFALAFGLPQVFLLLRHQDGASGDLSGVLRDLFLGLLPFACFRPLSGPGVLSSLERGLPASMGARVGSRLIPAAVSFAGLAFFVAFLGGLSPASRPSEVLAWSIPSLWIAAWMAAFQALAFGFTAWTRPGVGGAAAFLVGLLLLGMDRGGLRSTTPSLGGQIDWLAAGTVSGFHLLPLGVFAGGWFLATVGESLSVPRRTASQSPQEGERLTSWALGWAASSLLLGGLAAPPEARGLAWVLVAVLTSAWIGLGLRRASPHQARGWTRASGGLLVLSVAWIVSESWLLPRIPVRPWIPRALDLGVLDPYLERLPGRLRIRLFGPRLDRRTRAARGRLEALRGRKKDLELEELSLEKAPGWLEREPRAGSLALEWAGRRVLVSDASLRSLAGGLRALASPELRRVLFVDPRQALRPGGPMGWERTSVRLAEALQADLATGEPDLDLGAKIWILPPGFEIQSELAKLCQQHVERGGVLWILRFEVGALAKPLELLGARREPGHFRETAAWVQGPEWTSLAWNPEGALGFAKAQRPGIFSLPHLGVLELTRPARPLFRFRGQPEVDLGQDLDALGPTRPRKKEEAAAAWIPLAKGQILWIPSPDAFRIRSRGSESNLALIETMASFSMDGTPPLPTENLLPEGLPDWIQRPRLDRIRGIFLLFLLPCLLASFGALLDSLRGKLPREDSNSPHA